MNTLLSRRAVVRPIRVRKVWGKKVRGTQVVRLVKFRVIWETTLRPATIQPGSRGSLVGLLLVYWRLEKPCGGCGTGGPVLVVFSCQPAAHSCKLLALRCCP